MAASQLKPRALGLSHAYLRLLKEPGQASLPQFLSAAEIHLLELYRQILRVPIVVPGENRPTDPLPIDELERICDQLRALLGPADYYRVVFDPYEPETEAPVIGSLAHDLAEIYGDLYRGARRWEEHDHLEAQYEWRFGFDFHWGRHLVHALGAIHALHSEYSWDVPPLAQREA